MSDASDCCLWRPAAPPALYHCVRTESPMDRIPGTVSTVCQLLGWHVKREKWRDHFKTLWAILFNSGLFWKEQSRGPQKVHGSQSSGNLAQGTEKKVTHREHRPVPEASHPHRGVIGCSSAGSWISQVLQGPALKRCILRPHPFGRSLFLSAPPDFPATSSLH